MLLVVRNSRVAEGRAQSPPPPLLHAIWPRSWVKRKQPIAALPLGTMVCKHMRIA